MPVRQILFSVGNSPVALASNTSTAGHPALIYVQNCGGNTYGNIWLGGLDVTASNGVCISSNNIPLAIPGSGPVYAIGDNGTATVRIIEVF